MLKELLITQPTGKVRVKERSNPQAHGDSVAIAESNPNAKVLSDNQYVEWQISYYSKDKKESLCGLNFSKNNTTFYLSELSDLLYQAVTDNIIKQEDVMDLLSYTKKMREEKNFIESEFSISRDKYANIKMGHIDFLLHREVHPLILYSQDGDNFSIEVKVSRKQRAVGVQAMIFICIPLMSFENSQNFIGRKARRKEKLTLNVEKVNFIVPALKIFAMASEKHNLDIEMIIMSIVNHLFKDKKV